MQKKVHWIYSLFGLMSLFGLTYYGVIALPYAFHDDFYMWSYDPRKNYYGHTLHYFLAFIGRPLAGQIVSLESYFVHTLQDASYLRLTSVILCAMSAMGLAFWLNRNKVDIGVAILAGVGAFLAPGLQTVIIWSISVAVPAVGLVSVLAALVLLPLKIPPEVPGIYTKKMNWFLIFIAVALLVAGLYTYQPSVMIFLIFPFSRVLVASRYMVVETWKRLQVDVGVFVSSCLIYYASHRFITLPYYYSRFPQAEEQMKAHPQYQFKLLSFSQVPDRIKLLFNQLIPNALDFFSYDFGLSSMVVQWVSGVILAGAAVALFRGINHGKSADEKNRFVVSCFLFPSLVIALFLMANAPGLLAQGAQASARIYVSNSAMIFLLFCWAVFQLAGVFRQASQTLFARMSLGVVIAVLCFIAQHNTLRSAYLLSTELKYLESQIAPHIRENARFYIIRPRWTAGEVYTPTTFWWMDVPWVVRSIYVKYGKEANFDSSKVTNGTWVDPYEKAPNLVIVDVNRITDTIYVPSPGSPPITLVQKDYLDFDVIHIPNPTSPTQYFAVSTGEYDIVKNSCPPGGCSRVFAGPTLESVMEWIGKLGGESTVVTSSELNRSFGAANLMTDASPIWHSQSPPKYPEWIRIDYHSPRVAIGLRLQSQPPATGDPVHTRMPKDFVFQGSQDGEHWDDLLKVQGAVFTRGEEWKDWNFENKTAYKHYRLFITANNGHPALIAIYHLNLKMMAENNPPIMAEVMASSDLNSSLRANNLAGWQGAAPPWHSQNPAKFPEWVRVAYNEPVLMTRLRMQSQPPDPTGNPHLGRAPGDFIIQGSQDGQQWTDLLKVQGAKFTGGWDWKEWPFDNKTAYKYYRLYITATNGDPALVSINRLQFISG